MEGHPQRRRWRKHEEGLNGEAVGIVHTFGEAVNTRWTAALVATSSALVVMNSSS